MDDGNSEVIHFDENRPMCTREVSIVFVSICASRSRNGTSDRALAGLAGERYF